MLRDPIAGPKRVTKILLRLNSVQLTCDSLWPNAFYQKLDSFRFRFPSARFVMFANRLNSNEKKSLVVKIFKIKNCHAAIVSQFA
jgi:hypothetical protein